MSKDDLIDVQGTVVAVHSGGLYRVQCDQGHEVLAQLSGRMRRFRIKVVPGDRVTVGVSPYDPGPRHHHLPRSLNNQFEFPHSTTPAARRRRRARRSASGASRGRDARPRPAPHRAARRHGRRPSTIPSPVAFDTLGLEPSLLEGIRDPRLRDDHADPERRHPDRA